MRLGFASLCTLESTTYLHPADPRAQWSAGRVIALFPLTLLLQRRRVTTVLPRAHLEVKHAGMDQPSSEIFHENEILLASHVIAEIRRVHVDVACSYHTRTSS